MTDFFGNTIELGDEVAYSCQETASLRLGCVVGFGRKQVRVEIDREWADGRITKRRISKNPERLIIKPWLAIF